MVERAPVRPPEVRQQGELRRDLLVDAEVDPLGNPETRVEVRLERRRQLDVTVELQLGLRPAPETDPCSFQRLDEDVVRFWEGLVELDARSAWSRLPSRMFNPTPADSQSLIL